MSQLSRQEHVYRNVASGLIVAVIVGVGTFFIPGLWAFLGESVQASRWWYWFLLGFFLFALFAYVGSFVAVSGRPHRAYRADRFNDLMWRWNWGAFGQPTG